MTGEPQSIAPVGCTLGEGPVWAGEALWFTDIKQRRVYRLDPASDALRHWDAPAQVGWVLPAAEGGFVAGLQTGLHRFDPEQGAFTMLAPVEAEQPHNRLNDACTDRQGRLWFGSMHDGESEPSGAVYRADPRGIAAVAGGICITNGPAVSPDGRTLYHVDTLARTIHASMIGDDGAISGTRVFATVSDGFPDGPVVDAEGCVWVGLFDGWCVARFSPAGERIGEVRFPVANITKIAFGGPGLTTAYATTARQGLSAEALVQQPLAGNLFAFDPGAAGQPTVPIAPFAPTMV